jgi:hypothetical protein
MPRALPLHHPTADELRRAHELYVEREQIGYAYRVGRHMLAGSEFTAAEAIHLLMRTWNARAKKSRILTVSAVAELLEATVGKFDRFDDRHIVTLVDAERDIVAELYAAFREVLGGVGAAKALSLLSPRFFPIWDTKIAIAYLGYGWATRKAPAEHYLTFIDYAIEQCTAAVTEAEFGEVLLKTLDEWNYAVWTKGWMDPS